MLHQQMPKKPCKAAWIKQLLRFAKTNQKGENRRYVKGDNRIHARVSASVDPAMCNVSPRRTGGRAAVLDGF